MPRPKLSVVITTHDRAALVGRAIQSALSQDWPGVEVIVVDDGSRDATPELVRGAYPEVRYLRQATSQGPGPARNCGIRVAVNEWVLILDDDDTLLPHALTRVAAAIEAFPAARDYPVLQFARTNGTAPQEYLVARLHDYLSETLRGDFTPVIQARLFTDRGFAYPSLRVGAEALLWWQVAERYGIPTWALQVAHVGTDAPLRLTSPEHQIASAPEYARLQEVTLERFGELLAARYPDLYVKKRLGAAAYWLLAGERGKARMHLRHTVRGRHLFYSLALWGLSALPRGVTRTAFVAYRRKLGT